MKIAFVCPRFYPEIGGVERHTREVARRLVEQGHALHVITEKMSTKLPKSDTVDGIQVEYLDFGTPGFFKKFRIWAQLLARAPLFLQADIIHIHDVFIWYLPVRFLLFWKPVYATFHGYEGVVPPSRKAIFIRRVSSFLATKTIEVGHYIQKWYGTKPTEIVYGGVSENMAENKTPSHHLPSAPLRFVLIGRLADDMAMSLYLDFFLQLQNKRIPFVLDVCGDGPYRSKLRKFGTVHGFCKDISPYIEHADVVCASSYLTLIDAAARGKRIVAFYDNPLKKDYLLEFPLREFIIVTDSVQVAIDRLFSTTVASSLTELAKKARKLFSWDAITQTYLEIWKK